MVYENNARPVWYAILIGNKKNLNLMDNLAEGNKWVGRVIDPAVSKDTLRTYFSIKKSSLDAFVRSKGKGVHSLEEGSGQLIGKNEESVLIADFCKILNKEKGY